MSTRWVHRIVTLAVTVPVTLTGLVTAFAPGALAATDVATFTGAWTTECPQLPNGPEGADDGPYTCTHTATSLSCATVVDTNVGTISVKLCGADLVSGTTSGWADSFMGYPIWTCQDGYGTGIFEYRPNATDAPFRFTVTLSVVSGNIVINGSFIQAGTGRTIAVRASMPAVCSYAMSSPSGYQGTVTP